MTHIIRILQSDPQRAATSFFLRPAAVEGAPQSDKGPKLPEETAAAYHHALSRMLNAESCVLQPDRGEDYCLGVAAGIAAVQVHVLLAKALMEIESDTRAEFLASLE